MRAQLQRIQWKLIGFFLILLTLLVGSFSPAVAQSSVSCSVTYTIVNQWPGGFQGDVKITNTGSTAFNSWVLGWSFANGQTITQLWNASYTQSGASVSATNLSWNATIPPAASQNIGFLANWSGSNSAPTTFTVNGVTCGGASVPTPTSTTGTTITATSTSTPVGPTSTATRTSTATATTVTNTATATAATSTATATNTATATVATSTATRTSTATSTPVGPTSTATASPTSPPAGSHVANPYAGATSYLNPDYSARIDTAAAQTSNSALAAKMLQVKSYPTYVWLDRIDAIYGGANNAGLLSLEQHLDAALAQKQGNTPITAEFVIYNLPDRDCHALASNGTLHANQNGLAIYKADYIDPIAELFADPKYSSLRIVTVIEPDSLPNLVTNLSDPDCAAANASGVYVDGVRYAINQLHAIPNVYIYLDIGHSGWLGWDNNRTGAIQLYTQVIQGTTAGFNSIDGFVTNTANYTPVDEVNLPNSSLTINGNPIRSATYYEWNPHFDEADFTAALYQGFVSAGFPSSIGFLIDTGRNGWGATNRPTGATGSTVNDYVNSGRIDRRLHRGNWCNQSGTGIGARPQASPLPNVDAFVWVKPPGESDGTSDTSATTPNEEGKSFDAMCDPTYTSSSGYLTGAMSGAPHAGHWFQSQFEMLVQNAYPAFQ